MKSDILKSYTDYTIILNNRPVWDYKLYNGNLYLIADTIEEEFYTVKCEELLEYLKEENTLPSSVLLIDETSRQVVESYSIENNNLILITT